MDDYPYYPTLSPGTILRRQQDAKKNTREAFISSLNKRILDIIESGDTTTRHITVTNDSKEYILSAVAEFDKHGYQVFCNNLDVWPYTIEIHWNHL